MAEPRHGTGADQDARFGNDWGAETDESARTTAAALQVELDERLLHSVAGDCTATAIFFFAEMLLAPSSHRLSQMSRGVCFLAAFGQLAILRAEERVGPVVSSRFFPEMAEGSQRASVRFHHLLGHFIVAVRASSLIS